MELCALLKLADLTKSNCSWSVLLGFLSLPGLQEFLPGDPASHSWSELLLGWLLPTQHRWHSLCSHLGQLSGQQWLWQPPHLQPLCLHHTFDHFLWSQRGYICWRCEVHWQWGSLGHRKYLHHCLDLPLLWYLLMHHFHLPLTLSLMGCNFLSWSCWNLDKKNQLIGRWYNFGLARVTWHPFWIFN